MEAYLAKYSWLYQWVRIGELIFILEKFLRGRLRRSLQLAGYLVKFLLCLDPIAVTNVGIQPFNRRAASFALPAMSLFHQE